MQCLNRQSDVWGGKCGSQHGWCDSQFRKNDGVQRRPIETWPGPRQSILTMYGNIMKCTHSNVCATWCSARSPSSAFSCHLLQFVTIRSFPPTRQLTALGPRWGESNGLWAQLRAHGPFARYTFSNKNWQRNVISIRGAVAALSREKINCYLLGERPWQLLNGRDNGFIIAPRSSLTGGNEPQITDGVGGEEWMGTHSKQRGHHLTRRRFLAGVRSKNDKMTLWIYGSVWWSVLKGKQKGF